MAKKNFPRIIQRYDQLIATSGEHFEITVGDVLEILERQNRQEVSISEQKINSIVDGFKLGFVRGHAAGMRKAEVN